MKKILFVLLLGAATLAGCKKDDECPEVNVTAPASEVANLKAYLQANAIVAEEDKRGFFYRIESAGTGQKPTACSGVQVDYTMQLTNGTTVDNGSNVSFYLQELILGWQEGVPLVGVGGRIILYLPPSLGYGSTATPRIPANSNLISTINLDAVY